MGKLSDKFQSLDSFEKRKVHIKSCTIALSEWDSFCKKGKKLSYRDSVVLMKYEVDTALPNRALQAVIEDKPCEKISDGYLEPISALQDDDWEPPLNIKYAYYSIYNLYRKYCEKDEIDDWLIINQSMSSEVDEKKWESMLSSVLI